MHDFGHCGCGPGGRDVRFVYGIGPGHEGHFHVPFPGPFPGGGRGPWEHDVFFFRGGRRRRAGRGDVRAAILLLLDEEPRNGYQVMQEIEQRSEGAWRPSPGSVYPAFQLLADEGLVEGEARAGGSVGGNVFSLTEAGSTYVAENRERLGTPWQPQGGRPSEEVLELRRLVGGTIDAVRQIGRSGDSAQIAAATKLLAETRRSLYRILAQDEPPPDEG